MRVQELKVRQFRNYAELDFSPGERLNVLVGENAQGKSNLLESIYLLATTRSLRASRESEMVRSGAEMAAVSASIVRERQADVELQVSIFPSDKKSVAVNGVRRPRVLELLGQLNTVYFGSIDLGIVAGEPSVRRRWLNTDISQISPKYVFDLAAYKRVLEQRNRLLRALKERPVRQAANAPDAGLDIWTEQMVRYGAPLVEKRRFFVERLAPIAQEVHRALTDGRESLSVRYLPCTPLPSSAGTDASGEAAEAAFRQELGRVAAEELRRGLTLAGPQRDDLQFLINGMDARNFGSQGQQRTVVLSLKLAEFQMMEEYVGERPTLLLDDVMSDLDDARRAHLLDWMAARAGQTFLTCTSLRSFPAAVLDGAAVYRVADGKVFAQQADTAVPAESVTRARRHGAEGRPRREPVADSGAPPARARSAAGRLEPVAAGERTGGDAT